MNCQHCTSKMTGRSDKKFCSVKCKNDFHKQLRTFNKNVLSKIDGILHRNYAILVEITNQQKHNNIKVPRLQLDKAGFNFNYFTGTYKNRQDKTYHYVYDFAWMKFSTQEILITHKAYNKK